jgi:lauroyl/myristoyl acyltransferase
VRGRQPIASSKEALEGAGNPGARPAEAPVETSPRNGGTVNGRARAGGRSPHRATKAFEAPHKMEKETFLSHLAGLTLLSFWRTSSWMVGHVPAALSYRVGGWISAVGYAASPLRRKWLRHNFGHVLGVPPRDKAAGRLARAAYRNYSRYIMELMRLPWLKGQQLDNLVEAHGYDEFLEIYNEGRGVILVAGHMGNNEAAAAGFSKHGLQINVVGDDSSYRELYELFERQRTSWGVKMISWRNLRGVYKALRSHEGLVLLVDWGYREQDTPVRMFDGWTTLPAGPAMLAAKHGSPIVPFSVQRLADGTFRIAADPVIRVASDSPRDMAVATQAIATALEGHIARAPEQWYIFKPIWPLTEAEQKRLEQRHEAAMRNDFSGAEPDGGTEDGTADVGVGDRAATSEVAPEAG